MPSYSSLLLILPALSTLITAIPTALKTRDNNPTGISTCGPQCSHTLFDPDQATCATNKFLDSLSTTITIDVRKDCDPVIDTICKAASSLAQSSQPVSNLNHTLGNCEAHMLFPDADTTVPKDVNYDSCVQGFQSITTSCMLMGDATVRNEASVGKQFGVRSVMYQAVDSGYNWKAYDEAGRSAPGYLIGPPGVWGVTNWGSQKDADNVLGA